jgi:hypothetical protein
MTTRFYPQQNTPAVVARAVDAAWNGQSWAKLGGSTNGGNDPQTPFMLSRRPMPNGGNSSAIQNGYLVPGSIANFCYYQMFSEPLAAQTIAGTVKGQVWACETSATADGCTQAVIRVVSNDGQTVRGTLLAVNNAALSNELFVGNSSSYRNARIPRAGTVSLSSVVAQAGDRLCVEWGIRFPGAPANQGYMYLGRGFPSGTAGVSGVILPCNENETDTSGVGDTARIAWLEFSQDLTFRPEYVYDVNTAEQGLTVLGSGGTTDTTPPTFSAFSPAAGAISPTQAISITASDTVELKRVTAWADYADRSEAIFVNGAFTSGYDAASTNTPSGSPVTSRALSIVRDGQWLGAFTLRLEAIDAFGNVATTSAAYTLNASVGPVIGAPTPANASAIARTGSVSIPITDNVGISRVLCSVSYNSSPSREDVYDTTGFSSLYDAFSSLSGSATSKTLVVRRNGLGWLDSPTIKVTVLDTDGNVTTQSYSFAVSGYPFAPYVANISPADGATLEPSDQITFDVVVPNGVRRVLLGVAYPNDLGVPSELVNAGSADFEPCYTTSTRTSITDGYRFTLRRSPGWLYRPQPIIFGFDVTGQEL